jgi:hypothetical protein
MRMKISGETLVIILVADQNGVFALKSEREPPVAVDAHGPVKVELAVQRVQMPSG